MANPKNSLIKPGKFLFYFNDNLYFQPQFQTIKVDAILKAKSLDTLPENKLLRTFNSAWKPAGPS